MRIYNLDDNATKVLISSRLKGRALNWFHSKVEHLAWSIPDLLRDMQQMFDFRPAKLTLRKEFEARMWQFGESFANYFHEKLILANRVPIPDEELIGYVVDGVNDELLRNQARLMNFKSKTDLLKAFGRISFSEKKTADVKYRRELKVVFIHEI